MAKKKRKTAAVPVQAEPAHAHSGASSRSGGSSLWKTCALFAFILVFLHGFTWLFALKGYIKWGYGTAHIVSSILNAMGISNSVDYNIIYLRNDTWNVTSECTAINAVLLFAAFIAAYSSTLTSKAIGLIAGIPLIVAVNIFRLVVLGWVTEHWPAQARLFHDFIWETIFLFFIVALWFMWVSLVVNREKTAAVSR